MKHSGPACDMYCKHGGASTTNSRGDAGLLLDAAGHVVLAVEVSRSVELVVNDLTTIRGQQQSVGSLRGHGG